jgi:type IV secretory pathway TrbL component
MIETPAAIKIVAHIGKVLTSESAAEGLTVEMARAKAAHMATTEAATHTAAAAGETATHVRAATAEAAAVSSASAATTAAPASKRVNAHAAAESDRRNEYDHGPAQHCTYSFRRDRVYST